MNHLNLHTVAWKNQISRKLDERSQMKKGTQHLITFLSTKR